MTNITSYQIVVLISVLSVLLFNYCCKCDDDSNSDSISDSESHSKEEQSHGTSEQEDYESDIKTRRPSRGRRTRKPRVEGTSTVHPRLDIVPKLLIFEPDRLLWPFHYESDVKLPYDLVQPTAWPIPKPGRGRRWCTGNFGGRELVDDNGKCLQLNYDALILFLRLQHRGIKVAVAATIHNSSKIDGMKHLIRMFEFKELFSFSEIDEASPIEHITRIKEKSGLQFRDLVYLGCNKTTLDEIINELKVIVVYVDPQKGLDVKDAQEAARLYAIRPHVPGPLEKPLTVGKIVSDEAAANVYGDEVMKMQEERSSDDFSGMDVTSDDETIEDSTLQRNMTIYSIF